MVKMSRLTVDPSKLWLPRARWIVTAGWHEIDTVILSAAGHISYRFRPQTVR